ncbi:IST1 homolog [Protopterus annectens]|uniref:IST1 homolog n=1 Tax=Protopterus annectens TaxID=7888 RepID=UPI001CFA8578|nr:IST1 homolog [Protopterus annectens]XP_043925892.1 IST1 homolog [Protopterus annectens]
MHKLSVEAPPKVLVERYLIEIAKNYNVPYEPDAVVMAEAPTGVEAELIDIGFTDKKGGHGGGGGGGGFVAPAVGLGPTGIMPMPTPHIPFSYPQPKGAENINGVPQVGTYEAFNNFQPPQQRGPPPQLPTSPPTYESIDDLRPGKNLPPHMSGPSGPAVTPGKSIASTPSFDSNYDNFTLPELPSVPNTLPTTSIGPNSSSGTTEDIDFDDLSRRFEELKKKT